MKLKQGEFYKVEIVRNGRHLDYIFQIKEIIKDEYKVETIDGEKLYFYDKEIKYFKKTEPFSFTKEKYIFRKKGVKENLKPADLPKFNS